MSMQLGGTDENKVHVRFNLGTCAGMTTGNKRLHQYIITNFPKLYTAMESTMAPTHSLQSCLKESLLLLIIDGCSYTYYRSYKTLNTTKIMSSNQSYNGFHQHIGARCGKTVHDCNGYQLWISRQGPREACIFCTWLSKVYLYCPCWGLLPEPCPNIAIVAGLFVESKAFTSYPTCCADMTLHPI